MVKKNNLRLRIFALFFLVACAHAEPREPLLFNDLNVAQKATFFMEIYNQQYDIFQKECEHGLYDFEKTKELNQKLVLFIELEKLIHAYNHYASHNLKPPIGLEERLLVKTDRLLMIELKTKEVAPMTD